MKLIWRAVLPPSVARYDLSKDQSKKKSLALKNLKKVGALQKLRWRGRLVIGEQGYGQINQAYKMDRSAWLPSAGRFRVRILNSSVRLPSSASAAFRRA